MKESKFVAGSLFILLIAIFVFNVGVSDVKSKPPASTPTPDATPTPVVPADGEPTATPEPTPTATPTAEPTPTATPVKIPTTLDSWAWSSNIGWVDFRDIAINENNGLLSGYGWSPNIGWIKFHDLSDYPNNGARGNPAQMDLNTGVVSGWIRACAGTVGGETPKTGADCRSMDSRTDGWDGWIELADDRKSNDRVRMDLKTGKLSGFAWGSDVIGWLNFGAQHEKQDFTGRCVGSSDQRGVITFSAFASGGYGDYWYRWNGVGNYSKDANQLVIPASNKSSETATLQIIDMVDGKLIEPICPTVERKGNTINGSCTINGVSNGILNTFVGDSVTIALSGVWGGSGGPFTYKLVLGSQVENYANPTVKTFNAPFTDQVFIRATDRQGVITSNIFCGQINAINRELTLKIGPNGNVASQNEYRVKVGSNFGLKWINTLPAYSNNYIDSSNNPDGYTCSRSVAKIDGVNWVNSWENNKDQSGSVSDLNTSQVGKYTFSINCLSQKFGTKQASVLLNVILTTVEEI
jgi:hypothetical protein